MNQFKRGWLLLVMIIATAGVGRAEDALTALRNADTLGRFMEGETGPTESGQAFAITFSGISQTTFYEKKTEMFDGDLIVTNGLCVADLVYHYDHSPTFETLAGQPVSDDEKSRGRTCWRAVRDGCVMNERQNKCRHDLLSYGVRPDNTIVSTNSYSRLEKYRPFDREGFSTVDRYLIAMGKISWLFLNRLVAQTNGVNPDDLQTLEATGGLGGPAIGDWLLRYDPHHDDQIRAGGFTINRQERPLMTLTNSGQVTCRGLILPAAGTYLMMGVLHDEYQTLSVTNLPADNPGLQARITKILEHINEPLKPGSYQLFDMRGPTPKVSSE